MLNLIIMSVVLGCTVTDLTETGVAPMQDPTIQSLEKSAETLDRMIVKTEKMQRRSGDYDSEPRSYF
jgi:hypothetical protein